jgi:hypothetical protein
MEYYMIFDGQIQAAISEMIAFQVGIPWSRMNPISP